MSLLKSAVNLFPKTLELHGMMSDLWGSFEAFLIQCYNPITEDLETGYSVEEVRPESPESVTDIKEDLNPEDVEAQNVANKIIKEKKNPLEEMKKTSKIVRSRIDIQDNLYRGKDSVSVNQMMNLLTEFTKITNGIIAPTLIFAKNHGGNRNGIRTAVLYFMGMVPEMVISPPRRKIGG